MTAIITRPVSIPVAFHNTEITQLRKLLAFPEFAGHAQAELDFRMDNAEALVQVIKDNGVVMATLGDISVSYEELLHLATITEKKFYELPEGNIIGRLRDEVKAHLSGVQSMEANALKQAIADLA